MQFIKTQFLLTSLTAGLLLAGCSSKLDVQPVNDISNTTALAKSSDVEATLVGAYDALGSGDLYGGNLLRDGELLGDNGEVLWQGTFTDVRQIYRRNIANDNATVSRTWLDAYRAINIANTVLDNLTTVDAAKRTRVEGEAKFIRGSLFFELVRFYAKTWGDGDNSANLGIPIVLKGTTLIDDITSKIPRSTVVAVYDQVIKDLTEAESKLPASNGFFATKGAAAAQLSRVYLQKLDYPSAAAAANRVIASNSYQLAPTVDQAFDLRTFINGANTAETIFAVQVTDQDGVNNLNTFYASAQYGGRGSDITVTNKHLALYDAADERGNLFYQDENNYVRTAKFVNTYGNVQIFRLAEMYLTRAEANFRAGTTTGATPLADINIIRLRAGLPALTTAQLSLTSILRERRLELAFEGTLIHDLKRNRQSTQYSSTVFAWNSPRLVYPIPLREINSNPALVQNTGY